MFSRLGNNTLSSYGYLTQTFAELFRCYPISMMHDKMRKDDANFGGKIFLPPSALNKLSMLNISYPMLFELNVNETGNYTYAGVLEFTAEEGRAYLPHWMFVTLKIQPGGLLTIRSADLPLGKFVKIEPQSTDFLDISDPKAVLENALRKFSTLTVGDIIEICYNEKTFKIKILEVRPTNDSNSICVVETDLVTDFAPPKGYVEPDYKAIQQKQESQNTYKNKNDLNSTSEGSMSIRINYLRKLNGVHSSDIQFMGEGQKLSGKKIEVKHEEKKNKLKDISLILNQEPIHLDLADGQLFFGFPIIPPKRDKDDGAEVEPRTFFGKGQSLRKGSKRKVKREHESFKPKAPKSPEVVEVD